MHAGMCTPRAHHDNKGHISDLPIPISIELISENMFVSPIEIYTFFFKSTSIPRMLIGKGTIIM